MNSPRDLSNLNLDVYVYEITKHADGNDKGASHIVQIDSLNSSTELEPLVDRDINAFNEYYMKVLDNTGLSGFERAAIKTYLYWKTHPEHK